MQPSTRSRAIYRLRSPSRSTSKSITRTSTSITATNVPIPARSRDRPPYAVTPTGIYQTRALSNRPDLKTFAPSSWTSRTSGLALRSPLASRSPPRVFKSTHAVGKSDSSRGHPASIKSSIHVPSPGHKVATVTVSNPSKLNIVNSHLLSNLQQSFQTLSQDPELRVVVLTGGDVAPNKAPAFIGGADITEMISLSSSEEARTFITQIHNTCAAIRDCPVPVIARVHGFCLGAGLEIAASCDLRIATASSVFGMPEVKVGIPSVVEAALLPSLIGSGRTRRLLYLAQNVSAGEAERWGLVEKVVADDVEALDEGIRDWTERLVGMGPRAVRIQKDLIQKWENCSVVEGISAGVHAYAHAFKDGGKEPKEFMGSFVNRRKAP